MDTRVFAPIVLNKTNAKAFGGLEYLTATFSIPSLIDFDNVQHMQISLTEQNSNINLITTGETVGLDNIYYTTLFGRGKIKLPISVCEPLAVGKIYKMQIRFGYAPLWESEGLTFTEWKNKCSEAGEFSEWSEVILIKLIDKPELLFVNTILPSSPNSTVSAITSFSQESNEIVESYRFIVGEEDSGWLPHKNSSNYDSYQISQKMSSGDSYTVKYLIRSSYGYETSIERVFNIRQNKFLTLPDDVKIEVEAFSDSGTNICSIYNTQLGHYYCIMRSEDNLVWEDLYTFSGKNENCFEYADLLIEAHKPYYYGIQEVYNQEIRSNLLQTETPVVNDFEFAFLVGENKQLCLCYDNTISSFKYTTLVSKQDTLGSRYPLILRNGQAHYAEFSLQGLISFEMDKMARTFSDNLDFELTEPADIYYQERVFREEVESFLNNGKSKLFKSPTEGNLIINLMNVSLSPNKTLGRMISSFTATAYEVADNTITNVHNMNIVQAAEENIEDEIITKLGGTIVIPKNSTITLMDAIQNKLQAEEALYAYELQSINNLEVEVGDAATQPAVLSVGGVVLEIPRQRKYHYPLEINSDEQLSITAGDTDAIVNYTCSIKTVLSNNNLAEDYETQIYWGQLQIQKDTSYADIVSQIVGDNVVFNSLEQTWLNADKKHLYSISLFKQLQLDIVGQPDDFTFTIDNNTISMNQTCILDLPQKDGDYNLNITSQSTESLLLLNYYVIIDQSTRR